MSNICVNVTVETFPKLQLSGFKKFVTRFKNSCCNLKIRDLGAKCSGQLFDYFSFERSYDDLKSKGPCILLNKNVNFNKNKTESKMQNPTHSFKKTNRLLQLIHKLNELELAKEKREHFFVPFILSKENVLSQYIVY